MMSFTWGLSVFGLAQAGNLLSPGRAVAAFAEVTRSTREQLGPLTRPFFDVGNDVQRGFVDFAFRAFGVSGCSSCSQGRPAAPRQDSGWGPMPPIPGA
jgi:hypothetical protein